MNCNPLDAMLASVTSVLQHVETARQCYRRAYESQAQAATAVKNSRALFSRTNTMIGNRARKQAISETYRGTNKLHVGFATIPPECPLRQRFPELMAEVVSSIPEFRGSSGDDLPEIIHQYKQLCQQQRTLLLNVQHTIQHKHRIIVYERKDYNPLIHTTCYTQIQADMNPRGYYYKGEYFPTYVYLDHRDEILRTVFPLGVPNKIYRDQMSENDEILQKVFPLAVPNTNYRDHNSDNVVARIIELDQEMRVQKILNADRRTRAGEDHTTTKQRLTEFYQLYNPSRLATIDRTLVNYQGREQELFRKLEAKYIHEPQEEINLRRAIEASLKDAATDF